MELYSLSFSELQYKETLIFKSLTLWPNVVDLWYFQLWILLDQIIYVWTIKGVHPHVAKNSLFNLNVHRLCMNWGLRKFELVAKTQVLYKTYI